MMTTATKLNGQADEKITALYCRLSVDDDNKDEESNSITNQKQILQDFAKKEGFTNTMFFVDDGVSGTTFQRPSFQRMERMAENGEIGTIIVKDLSRFGREQVEMGRLTQVVYPSLGIRFIAIQERVDTLTGDGVEMMPFHNIFNEWYAAQTSKKIRAVWHNLEKHFRVRGRDPAGGGRCLPALAGGGHVDWWASPRAAARPPWAAPCCVSMSRTGAPSCLTARTSVR